MADILILVDKNGRFETKRIEGKKQNYVGNADVLKIVEELKSKGHSVIIRHFSDIQDPCQYSKFNVLYASSEDRGHFYKAYIEDIILGLEMAGANVIPEYKYLRAHENKAFQEVLRKSFCDEALKRPRSKIYYDERTPIVMDDFSFPVVVKDIWGSASSGVMRADSYDELIKSIRLICNVKYRDHFYSMFHDIRYNKIMSVVKNFIKRNILHDKAYLSNVDRIQKHVVIQEYIPGLAGDFKVLYFAGHYYVLERKNREGDFRASGSGRFSFPDDVAKIRGILEFARRAVAEIATPMVSMDVAQNQGGGCYLLEFQCLSFGKYAQQFADCYYEYDETKMLWNKLPKKELSVEDEIVRSVLTAIQE